MFSVTLQGVGYQVRIEKTPDHFDLNKIMEIIRRTVPKAEVEDNKQRDVNISLNTLKHDGFDDMFKELETLSPSLGIETIGVKVATMKDLYIK